MNRRRRSARGSLPILLALGLPLTGCGDDSGAGGGGGGGAAAATTSATTSVTTSGSTSSASTTTTTGAATTSSGGGGSGTGGSGSGGGGSGGGGSRFDALIEAVEAELAQSGAPGAAVAILEGGEVTFARGFGTKVPGEEVPVEATTLFRIGSVTKSLTAAAVLTEVERGAIALDASVLDHEPLLAGLETSWPAEDITLRHLLTHRGGLRDHLEFLVPPAQHEDDALHAFLTSDAFFNRGYLIAPPGAIFNYSNSNYYLAGLLGELTSSLPYRELVRERIFSPLGMDRATFLPSEVLADGDYASGLTTMFGPQEIVTPDFYDNAWARPAGFAFTSVAELADFAAFLLNGDEGVLSDELRLEMQSPVVATHVYGDLLHYGYGLEHTEGLFVGPDFHAVTVVQHEGLMPGFVTQLLMIPELGFGFVAVVSQDHAYLDASLRTALTTLVDLPAPVAPPDVSVTPEELAAFAGTYQDDFNVGPMLVSAPEGGPLRIRMRDLEDAGIPYEPDLQHYADETFVLGIQGTTALISFLEDEEGQVRFARTRFAVGVRPDASALPAAQRGDLAERRARILAALAHAPRAVPASLPRIAPR